jgi:DNA-formamidopyrimidine glycosylase
MPEGPEVRIMAEGLSQRILGKSIVKIGTVGGKWLKKPINGLEHLSQIISQGNSKVEWVKVKGKAIYAKIGELYMWNTLGMSGGWRDQEGKHSHFSIILEDGSSVFFHDIRRFGNISFHKDLSEISKKIDSIGPDLLNDVVLFEKFKERLARKNKTNICKVLMDQKVLGGIGNYIKSEALYRAGISPLLNISDIPEVKLKKLWFWCVRIMQTSYKQGGATFLTYSDMNGDSGKFVFSFLVYRKETDPEGHKVIHEVTPDGRMTHWVPQLQN